MGGLFLGGHPGSPQALGTQGCVDAPIAPIAMLHVPAAAGEMRLRNAGGPGAGAAPRLP